MTVVIMAAMQITLGAEPAKKFATAEEKIEYAKKNLAAAFQTGNPGIIESAARLTAVMKMRNPETDVTALTGIMEKISNTHPSGCTRYKMYVALHICSNPEWYANELTAGSADQDSFFRTAATRMQEKLLSASAL